MEKPATSSRKIPFSVLYIFRPDLTITAKLAITLPKFRYSHYNKIMLSFLASSLRLAHIPFTQNEPLAPKSTFRVGGTAKLFVSPQNPQELCDVISAVRAAQVNYFILGGGSNLVFPDGEYNGVIVSTKDINQIFFDADANPQDGEALVTCQCGVPMATLVDFCTKKNLSGMEQFAGLPGSVGGAVFMNARCFDRSVSDIIFSTKHLEFQGKNPVQRERLFSAQEWDYKRSPFQSEQSAESPKIVLEATFRLAQKTQENHADILAECKKYISERVEKGHFKYPSAGSVFKNNRAFGAPSGKLIDECGLKGLQIGGAQIAPFHGNFIVNTGNATARDIRALVEKAQSSVKEKFGFDLEPEIVFV